MDLPLAERGQRLIASLIDASPIFVLQVLIRWVHSLGTVNNTVNTVVAGYLLLLFVYAIYQIAILVKDGQTIGKKIMHVKIVGVDSGHNPGYMSTVIKRSILNTLLSLIPIYAIVDDLLIIRDDHRCIHDFIAGTVVVKAA